MEARKVFHHVGMGVWVDITSVVALEALEGVDELNPASMTAIHMEGNHTVMAEGTPQDVLRGFERTLQAAARGEVGEGGP